MQHMVATGDPGRALKPLTDLPSPSEASMTRSAGAVHALAMLNLLVPAQISFPERHFDQIETQELGVAALFETGLKHSDRIRNKQFKSVCAARDFA